MEKRPLQTSNATNIPSKTIEEMYQKKTQLEHILLRPDTYVGSIEKHTQNLWVYENDEMVQRSISYVPGLYKIFDEILVNAADNKQRDPSMDSLKVTIDPERNTISVYNNGDGVPVEIHQEEKVYVPELIFGHLLTSSNYDDNVKKTTGGRNGYGAKLTNIFSTEFVIETADGRRLKKYKQVFSNNMGTKSEPVITKCKANENWTKVTFKPDLEKFKMTYLEEDVVALMKKRVLDMAGCLGKTVKVELNGTLIRFKSFRDYADLFLKCAEKSKPTPLPRIHAKVGDRWEICVSLSDGQFQQVSFVNSIATIKGGTHVDYITNQITAHVMNKVNKKKKDANVKAHTVKNHLWVFVNALIDNPAFDSQTKETLTTRQASFGSKCDVPESMLKDVEKSGIVDTLLSWADFKQSKDLKKTDGTKTQRIRGIVKLEDANDAGGRNSEKCTLILTEGDSAKALAMAGLSVVGRDHYGVFPLRGKLLNVREASSKQIMENEEIQNIKKILGLQQNKEYTNVKSLRYGHLMIMADQASHSNGTKLSFYSMPEYETWRERLGNNANGWKLKYYKGLGTSTPQEGREYFRDLDKHRKDFIWEDELDGNAIELAFSKKKAEDRKTWIRNFEGGKDHASSRYIYTELNTVTRCLFHEDDDKLLQYLNEEGRSIEPNWYIPIIPLVLVNGSEGIGTGWSSYIPNYNPREIIANVRRLLNEEEMVPMDPWYRGFRGTIEKSAKEGGYIVNGSVVEIDEQTFRITELPIRKWTQDYKQFLESITDGTPNVKDPLIEDFRQNGDDAIIDIEVKMKPEKIASIMQEGLFKKFKLTNTISTSNMHLFDAEGKIKKFDTPEQILEEFYPLRMEYYERRKKYILANLERLLLILDNKVRFILGVVNGEIIVSNRKKAELLIELKQKGFTPMRKGKSAEPQVAGANDDSSEGQEDGEQETVSQPVNVEGATWGDYEYLLSLPIGTLTLESVQKLLDEKAEKEKEHEILMGTPTKSLWLKDLDDFEKKLDELDSKEAEDDRKRSSQASKKTANGFAAKPAKKPPQPRKNTKKNKNVEPENDNSSTEVENVVEVVKPKGRAGSKNTQKKAGDESDILSLQERLAAYNFESSGEKSGENVVEVVKPKGRAGSKNTQKKAGDESDILSLQERLAAYNFESSGEKSGAMESEEPVPAGKKQINKRAGAKKMLSTIVLESDSDNEDDGNFEVQQKAAPTKKGGRKPAAQNTKAPALPKKRNVGTKQTLGKKLLTGMLQPAESTATSPEKKARKMRESSIEDLSAGSASNSPISEDEVVEIAPQPARARPQRANRTRKIYVVSESESDHDSDEDAELSDMEEDDD
ncbi:hypothetical protein TSUD_325240 [Trifolium subterraneum]|uniref:DNA topoisomerase 2 n=2 Tax=Trifolium TaxID=3898 RepID=A0A2Z6MQR9_TRISU|nr:hypothetical protein TSUD_325240 [Trifolium subterraneum]